ncbi:MAG: cytochrome C, partial [Pirellulales bacterium]|nr:cytochrome C [Pirellulales bacterium]
MKCLHSVIGLILANSLISATIAGEFPTPSNTEKSIEQPLGPMDVVKSAKLPPGFRLSVYAAEPDVQNPIAMTTDERGRLWVAENYTWAGAENHHFDDKLRDRVVIFQDTDGDGRHDQRTVFWDQARKLTSVEVGFGGVWLLCPPQLLFLPDHNRDDIPDCPPVVVLDGFDDKEVGHTIANGLKWGPDGWLYGRHGILATSNIGKPGVGDSQRVKINAGVWRYHPTRGIVEAVMHGMTNPWGFDFDEHGEMFVINTVIGHLWHVIPGARTQRMFGVDFNPHAYQLIPQTADHVHWDTGEAWNDIHKGVTDKTSAAGGGHAHIGLLIYQGDNWPAEYHGRVFTLNLHGRRINSDLLERRGAGYTAKHGPDMCFIADPWFRGMELIAGPDGSVFIADWSDTGECHDHDGVHRTSGRIYRLTYGAPRAIEPFDLAKLDDQALVQWQLSANDWQTRQARRLLQERATLNEATRSAIRQPLLDVFSNQSDAVYKLRAMWALHVSGGANEAWL